ncbi:MAG: DUF5657 family protein [Candidatus Dojkabacteria bacterium]|jgi:hypothetical protein|nr:DUF5657 family protein [Candidatus Dojkabacteria bacterium]
MESIYEQLFTNSLTLSINLGDILKIPLVVILLANIFYSFMLLLKVKVLIDTIETESGRKIKRIVYLNLGLSIVVGMLGTFIILLG